MGRIRMPALTVSFLLLAAACGDSDAPVSTATSSAATTTTTTTQGPAVSTSTTSVVSASTTIGVNSTRPPASASSTTAPVEGGVLVSAAAGGAVVSDDGLLRLVVPAGALDEDTMIGLTRMDLDVGLAGSVPTFALQPDGLAFSTPAAAVLDLDGLFGDDGGRPLGAVAILGASGSAVPRQTLTLLDGAATLVFEVSHFSFLMVLGGKTVFEIFPMEVDTGVGAVWEARLDVRDSPSLDGAVWDGRGQRPRDPGTRRRHRARLSLPPAAGGRSCHHQLGCRCHRRVISDRAGRRVATVDLWRENAGPGDVRVSDGRPRHIRLFG